MNDDQAAAYDEVTTVLSDIHSERVRQIVEEKWTSEHDDEHRDGELARAGAAYALPPGHRYPREQFEEGTDLDKWNRVRWFVPLVWPKEWHAASWKPTKDDRRRELVKAGALIVAEIQRLDRAKVLEVNP